MTLVMKLANEGHLDVTTMEQQLHLHLITLLMHIEDEDENVRKSTKRALLEAVKFLTSRQSVPEAQEQITKMFAKPHMGAEEKTNFEEFMNDLCETWVVYYAGA